MRHYVLLSQRVNKNYFVHCATFSDDLCTPQTVGATPLALKRRTDMINNGNLFTDIPALVAVFVLGAYGVIFLANTLNLL
jgi:hypothetical protein